MKVINRSDSTVTYSIPEINVRRVFAIGETKDIPPKEINALYQMDGGAELIKHHLLVEDEQWVYDHWEAPLEYFWKKEDIVKSLKEDSIELFSETLDYAPQGVLEMIKEASWRMPLTDLNKINLIQTKLGFDVQTAIKIMSEKDEVTVTPAKKERLRRKES